MSKICHEYQLWEGRNIPFALESDKELTEHLSESIGDGVDRLTDVTVPTLTWFPAVTPGPAPAVLVCPGGGYTKLAYNKEGFDTCRMLNLQGITAFLLKYRCLNRRDAAFVDGVRAMRFIRHNSEKFNVAADKIGVIGFSAGGHLAARVSAPADPVPYPIEDDIDRQSFRPDFTALIYPAYMSDPETLTLTDEFKVDSNTPPTYMSQAQYDPHHAENIISWYLALTKAGVPAELHIWPEKSHGCGLIRTGLPSADWPESAARWLRRQTGIQ